MSAKKKNNVCTVCEQSEEVFEIPRVSAKHSSYNISSKPSESHWICGPCLLSVFNDAYLKNKAPLQKIESALEFAHRDMTIMSTIYFGISEVLLTRSAISLENKEKEEDFGKMMKEMPETSKILEFDKEALPRFGRESIIMKTGEHRYYNDDLHRLLLPKEIESKMKKVIIGQDKLVKDLSIAAYKYLLSQANPQIKRPSVFIMGPSGTGKTESIKTLAKILDRPLFAINSSMLTPSGYRGDSIDSIAEKLIDLYKDKAKNVILYFDEFDKLLDPDGNAEVSEFRKAVLPELYKILDGDEIIGSTHKGAPLSLPTKGMLVIMTGAFQKLEDSKNKKSNSRKVGLGHTEGSKKSGAKDNKFSFADITNAELIDYGCPVELIGRFSMRTHTIKFEREDYLRILRGSNASILREYTQIFKAIHSTVVFTDEFLLSIVDKALLERTGARTMYALIEERLLNLLYDVDFMVGKNVTINKDSVDISKPNTPDNDREFAN